jgi:hypothetical protein
MITRRIQLRRFKGWKQPASCVRVCRPLVFGNPFTRPFGSTDDAGGEISPIAMYRRWIQGSPMLEAWALFGPEGRRLLDDRRAKLLAALPKLYQQLDGGAALGCFCRADAPCHADVLLELWRERWEPAAIGGVS